MNNNIIIKILKNSNPFPKSVWNTNIDLWILKTKNGGLLGPCLHEFIGESEIGVEKWSTENLCGKSIWKEEDWSRSPAPMLDSIKIGLIFPMHVTFHENEKLSHPSARILQSATFSLRVSRMENENCDESETS